MSKRRYDDLEQEALLRELDKSSSSKTFPLHRMAVMPPPQFNPDVRELSRRLNEEISLNKGKDRDLMKKRGPIKPLSKRSGRP